MKKSKKGYVHGATYCVGNCDSTEAGGWVCFGGNGSGRSLRQSNHLYWSSVFNNSPTKYVLSGSNKKEKTESLVEKMKAYKAGDRTRTDTRNITHHNMQSYIFGKEFMASSKPTMGVMISFDKKLIADNPMGLSANSGAKVGGDTVKAVIGLVNYISGSWMVDLPNGDTIRLSGDQVVVR